MRRAQIAAAVAGVTLVTGTVIGSGNGAAGVPTPVSPQQSITQTARTITLITGDRVRYVATASGVQVVGTEAPVGRRPDRMLEQRLNGHQYVLPLTAVPLVTSGRLDRGLFDITQLAADHYDDAHMAGIPLIIEHSTGAAVPHAAPAGATTVRTLPDLDMQVVREVKRAAPAFWQAVTGSGKAPRALATGTKKIWLDGTVRPTADVNVRQIGAPTAWAHGDTGQGVRVAALDTGYDHNHPDLRGRVVGEKNFTDAADTTDHIGHGTHVSSILAGTGAASGGHYAGVAPGAQLLEGKVFDDQGLGLDDWLLAGMQWAIQQGARVVNMSVGGGAGDGTGPLETAINQLTATSGTLFVVAAGNDGRPGTVEEPSTAQAALSVASVTTSARLSYFSSQGPRSGDFGLKPDIAAPGSDIIAARAAGTNPDEATNDYYAKMSGTSMATPHVAGAAALLAEEHPAWKAPQLKAALMDSAQPIAGTSIYGQGAGMVDVTRAYTQTVRTDTGSEFLGDLAWPYSSDKPTTKVLTYYNDGAVPVTLRLRLTVTNNGKPAPAGLFRLTQNTVTIPAHSHATATVGLEPAHAMPGQYGGELVARGPHAQLTTPVGAHAAVAVHPVTISGLDRAGKPGAGAVIVQGGKDGADDQLVAYSGNSTHLQLPAGTYRALAVLYNADFSTDDFTFAAQRFTVSGPTTIRFDARAGKPVTDSVPEPTGRPEYDPALESLTSSTDGDIVGDAVAGWNRHLYTVASTSMPGLTFSVSDSWDQPKVAVDIVGHPEFQLPIIDNSNGWVGDVTAPLVDVGPARPQDLAGKNLTGAIAFYRPAEDDSQTVRRQRVTALAAAGAVLVLFDSDDFIATDPPQKIPVLWLADPTQAAQIRAILATTPLSAHALGIRASSYGYFLLDRVAGHLPAGITWRHRHADLARVDSTFHTTGETDAPDEIDGVVTADGVSTLQWLLNAAPWHQVEYLTPGVQWQLFALAPAVNRDAVVLGEQTGLPATYRAGERIAQDWNQPPYTPQFPHYGVDPQDGKPVPWVYRSDRSVAVHIPVFSDSGGHFSPLDPDDTGSTVLLRDNRQIGHSNVPGIGTFTVPADRHRYTLQVNARRNIAGNTLSNQTQTTWSFDSRLAPGRKPLPLMAVRYGLKLSDTDTAAGPLPLILSVSHQPGAASPPITAVRLWTSVDKGARWTQVRVHHHGRAGWTTILPPAGAGYVNLRVSATDAAGNTVTEIVDRAYRSTR